jgi:hypothetical protein
MGLGRGVRAPHVAVCALRRLLCDALHMFGELRAIMVCVHKKRQQNDYIRLFTVAPMRLHSANHVALLPVCLTLQLSQKHRFRRLQCAAPQAQHKAGARAQQSRRDVPRNHPRHRRL